jgi:hypothetical protein
MAIKQNTIIPPPIKFIEKIDTFSNTGPHTIPYMLTGSQYEHH